MNVIGKFELDHNEQDNFNQHAEEPYHKHKRGIDSWVRSQWTQFLDGGITIFSSEQQVIREIAVSLNLIDGFRDDIGNQRLNVKDWHKYEEKLIHIVRHILDEAGY